MGDLNAFREDTRRWLEEHAPPSMRTPPATADEICWGGKKGRYPDETRRWLAMMAERGWTAPTWPREYGGGGLSKEEAKVLAEEMAKLQLRPPLIGFGLAMIGPLLLQDGTEEQKREHLPHDRARRDPLVPGLLRAGRRLRPGVAADARRARRRRLHPQRPEGLDVVRRQVGLDVLPRAHRPQRRSRTASRSC